MKYPAGFGALMRRLSSLPGIGRRSAERIVFHLLALPEEEVQALAEAMLRLRRELGECGRCFALCDTGGVCSICADPRRDKSRVCVVEHFKDVFVFEEGGAYRGLYHVLGGAISPLDGVHPEDLHIEELVDRVRTEGIAEVIVATNPTVAGDTTAVYIASRLKGLPVKVTRLAAGMPVGGELEYADPLTLARALEGRGEISIDE